jgi:hypothetical protein
MIHMKQDLEISQIQYLMIFLRKMPSEGLDEFQRQLLQVAAYTPEGTNRARPYQAYIGRDTKSRIFVTGDTPLDEGNILAGFIMEFPQLDLASSMISIQKFSLKGHSHPKSEEDGAIVVAENWGVRKIRWNTPCRYDLRKKQIIPLKDSTSKDSYEESRGRQVHVFASFRDQIEPSDDMSQTGPNEEIYPRENMNDLRYDESVKEIDGVDEGLALKGSFLDDPDFRGFLKATEPMEDEELEEIPHSPDLMNMWSSEDAGAKPKEDYPQQKTPAFIDFLEQTDGYEDVSLDEPPEVGRKKRTLHFDEEADANEYFDAHSAFGEFTLDQYESSIQADQKSEKYEQSKISEEGLYESETENTPRSSGSFTLLGTMDDDDETEAIWESDANQIPASIGTIEESPQGKVDRYDIVYPLKRILQEKILDRLRDLPIRKLYTTLIVIGAILIALSLGVKILEPDMETARKAAGIADVYDWIIKNNLLERNTEDWYPLWKDSPEYRQYWAWFDNQWSKTINGYHTVEGIFAALGVLSLVSGMAVFLLPSFLHAKPTIEDDASSQMESIERKRISLSFFADIDPWPIIDTWTKINGFRLLEAEGPRRLYRKSGDISHPPIMFMLSNIDGNLQLEVWPSTRVPTILLPIFTDLGIEVLESKKGQLPKGIHEAVNLLLESLGQEALL